MEAYHEEKAPILSKNKIRVFKNVKKRAGYMVKSHWHDSYEILFIKEGFGEQQINDQKFCFEQNSVIVICPGDIHSTIASSSGGCDIDVLQFVPEFFGSREDLIRGLVSSIAKPDGGEISALIDNIKKHADSEKSDDELILSGAMFMLCGILIQHCESTASIVRMTAFTRSVCEYIRDLNDIKLESVSRHFGYSPEHFSRKFHADLGISYKHYCEKIKIKHILKLLDDDSISLSQIAENLEYSDTSSFVRAFKRIYGITPGSYRKLKNRFN